MGDIPGTEEALLSSKPEVAVYRGKSVGLYKFRDSCKSEVIVERPTFWLAFYP